MVKQMYFRSFSPLQVYKSTSFEKHTTVAAVEAVGSRVTFTIWDTTGELEERCGRVSAP